MALPNGLKLYEVKGFFIQHFFLLASNQKKAEKEARKAVIRTLRVAVCPEEVESPETYGI